jgi:hypothetical protein
MNDRLETGRGPPPLQVVHTRQIEEEIESALRIVPQVPRESRPVRW